MGLKEAFIEGVSKVAFNAKKMSPEILIIAGIGGVIFAGVWACKESPKASKDLKEMKKEREEIKKEVAENPDSDAGKELTKLYFHTGMQMVKYYGGPVILGGLSVMSLLASHDIMRRRNLGLSAAYAALDRSYDAYRNRVRDRYGDETEKELKYGIKKDILKEKVKDEDGKEKTVKQPIEIIEDDINDVGPYARYFDEYSLTWVGLSNNIEYNMQNLELIQRSANDNLRAKGYVFLNDIYKELGFEPTQAGQVMGWTWKVGEGVTKLDNYIDFGIRKVYRKSPGGEYKPTVLLDFNVDGNILDRFKKR